MNTHQINGVVAPSLVTDAANKQYVDSFAMVPTNYIQNTNSLQSGARRCLRFERSVAGFFLGLWPGWPWDRPARTLTVSSN